MQNYDYIIVGAGIGGIATGNFLTKYGKKVLIVEKNAKAGGQLTSFKRGDFSFDSSIFHLNLMGEKEIINEILRFWGKQVDCQRVYYEYNVVTNGRTVKINTANFKEDLKKGFPDDVDDIERYFKEVERLTAAIANMKSMKPPFKMTLGEKLSFVWDVLTKRRLIMKYTKRESIPNLRKYFKNEEIIKFIYSIYPVESLTAYYHMYGIGMPVYYPKGGMEGLTNEIVDVYKGYGGELRLNTEVQEVILEDGKAVGIKTTDGEIIKGGAVISDVAPHFTYGKLVDRKYATPVAKEMIEKRNLFESFCFIYLGIDKSYKMDQNTYLIPTETVDFSIRNADATPENCAISLIKYPCQKENEDYSVLLVGFIPYEYNDCWGTGGNKVHTEKYQRIKKEAGDKIIDRVCKYLGDDFKDSIKVKEIATPLSFERYTNVEKGAVMGWSNMGWKVSPSMMYIPFETAIKDFYLTGQFTFPSGGIPGVLSAGYYLACELLEKDNIDLYHDFRKFRGLI